jgi:hypothetical protein
LINSAFSLSQLIKYEPWVDDTIHVLIAKLRQTFVRDESSRPIMNMMEWFAYFSLDVITDRTFGERSGFLETGTDVTGTISENRKMMEPWLCVSGNELGVYEQANHRAVLTHAHFGSTDFEESNPTLAKQTRLVQSTATQRRWNCVPAIHPKGAILPRE